MQEECNWSDRKVNEFIQHLKISLEQRIALQATAYAYAQSSILNTTPSGTNVFYEGKTNEEHKIDISSHMNNNNINNNDNKQSSKIKSLMESENITLPALQEFCIPKKILEQKHERSNKDIIQCFEDNNIHFELLNTLQLFFETEQVFYIYPFTYILVL